MTIIVENQEVEAGIAYESGALEIEFSDEPGLVLGETVLIDLMQRSIGIIYQNTYHHIGALPQDVDGASVAKMKNAWLRAQGAGGRELTLQAPIKIAKN